MSLLNGPHDSLSQSRQAIREKGGDEILLVVAE